jgi:hypothetical protein
MSKKASKRIMRVTSRLKKKPSKLGDFMKSKHNEQKVNKKTITTRINSNNLDSMILEQLGHNNKHERKKTHLNKLNLSSSRVTRILSIKNN